MVPAHPLTRPVAFLVLLLLVTACGSDGGDRAAFCDGIERLRRDDPFAELPVASPGEMRDAFDDLREAAEAVAADAPSDAEVAADRYLASVDELLDQLRGAGFDLTELDLSAYRRATSDYGEAAESLDNAGSAICAEGE